MISINAHLLKSMYQQFSTNVPTMHEDNTFYCPRSAPSTLKHKHHAIPIQSRSHANKKQKQPYMYPQKSEVNARVLSLLQSLSRPAWETTQSIMCIKRFRIWKRARAWKREANRSNPLPREQRKDQNAMQHLPKEARHMTTSINRRVVTLRRESTGKSGIQIRSNNDHNCNVYLEASGFHRMVV